MTHGTLNLPPSNGTGRCDSVEGDCPCPAHPQANCLSLPSEFKSTEGGDPAIPRKKAL